MSSFLLLITRKTSSIKGRFSAVVDAGLIEVFQIDVLLLTLEHYYTYPPLFHLKISISGISWLREKVCMMMMMAFMKAGRMDFDLDDTDESQI